MKKLGIIGAMDIEIATLKEAMEHVTVSQKAGTEFCEGTLGGLPVVLVRCGIGKVNAAICTQILCDCFGVTHIVNTGIAGSLEASQDIGDMVVSSEVWHHDFDCMKFGYPVCKIPGMPQGFPADQTLMEYAKLAADMTGSTVRIGRVASGDQFVAEQALKEQIIQRTQALCTEMEGAAIAQTAYRNQIPFVILRTISDLAEHQANVSFDELERYVGRLAGDITVALLENL